MRGDQFAVGGVEGLLANEPARGMAQLIDRDAVGAMPHAKQADVGAVGDHCRQEVAQWHLLAGLIPLQRLEHLCEATPAVNSG